MLTLLAALMLSPAHAGDALTFSAVKTVVHGQDTARVIFHSGVSGHLNARAECSGKTFRISRDVSPRSDVELRFDGLPEGEHGCDVYVELYQSNGAEGELSFHVDVASLPIVQLSSTWDDIDLAAGKAVVHASRAVHEARVTVYGAKGVQLDQTMADTSDPEHLKLSWNAQGREVVKLVVEARDEAGFASELELLPWSYAIPHEDVVFETGSAEIRPGEVPKLDNAWADVVRVIDLYGEVVKIELFVAGYTDTVGDAGSNQALSERRARAIAAWFQAKGFPGRIHFQGFGESALAVKTGDEVDEAANRRALYVLAAQPPPVSEALPKKAWKGL